MPIYILSGFLESSFKWTHDMIFEIHSLNLEAQDTLLFHNFEMQTG